MDKHQKALIAEEHSILASALLEWHKQQNLLERSKLLQMKPKKESIAQLKKIIDDLKKAAKKAGPWTKKIFDDEIAKMERQLNTVVMAEGMPRYNKDMKNVMVGKGKPVTKLKKGDRVKVVSKGDDYDGQVGVVYRPENKKQAATIEFKDRQIVSFSYDELVTEAKTKWPEDGTDASLIKMVYGFPEHDSYSYKMFDQMTAELQKRGYKVAYKKSGGEPHSIKITKGGKLVKEEAASIGNGTIPTGPESVGVKPDFKFRGHVGFDCDPNTFTKCIKGKKKHKRWNTFLDRDDELVGKVKTYMGQSYKNTNFVLRNTATGEMVMGRRVS